MSLRQLNEYYMKNEFEFTPLSTSWIWRMVNCAEYALKLKLQDVEIEKNEMFAKTFQFKLSAKEGNSDYKFDPHDLTPDEDIPALYVAVTFDPHDMFAFPYFDITHDIEESYKQVMYWEYRQDYQDFNKANLLKFKAKEKNFLKMDFEWEQYLDEFLEWKPAWKNAEGQVEVDFYNLAKFIEMLVRSYCHRNVLTDVYDWKWSLWNEKWIKENVNSKLFFNTAALAYYLADELAFDISKITYYQYITSSLEAVAAIPVNLAFNHAYLQLCNKNKNGGSAGSYNNGPPDNRNWPSYDGYKDYIRRRTFMTSILLATRAKLYTKANDPIKSNIRPDYKMGIIDFYSKRCIRPFDEWFWDSAEADCIPNAEKSITPHRLTVVISSEGDSVNLYVYCTDHRHRGTHARNLFVQRQVRIDREITRRFVTRQITAILNEMDDRLRQLCTTSRPNNLEVGESKLRSINNDHNVMEFLAHSNNSIMSEIENFDMPPPYTPYNNNPTLYPLN